LSWFCNSILLNEIFILKSCPHAFDGRILRVGVEGAFFGFSSTLIDAHTLPGQTEGLKGGFAKVDNVFLRLGGFAKVDKRFGYEKWLQGGCKGWIHLYKRYV
jgi:hypothetical protein